MVHKSLDQAVYTWSKESGSLPGQTVDDQRNTTVIYYVLFIFFVCQKEDRNVILKLRAFLLNFDVSKKQVKYL